MRPCNGFIKEPESSLKTDSAVIVQPEEVENGGAAHGAAPVANFDIDKLAYCVAVAETNNCTKGMGITKNNCFGIMYWPNGKRTGKTYLTRDDSYADFKRIWLKSYKTFPTYSMAVKWTGNDNAQRWLNIVTNCYNN